jgi:hypothetical protein
MNLHPTSALYGLGFLPDFTVYHEVRIWSCVRVVRGTSLMSIRLTVGAHEQGLVSILFFVRPSGLRPSWLACASFVLSAPR